MSTMKVCDINSALLKKGFVLEKNRDHIFYCLHIDGKKTKVWTKISHGEKEIRDPLIKRMEWQTHLNKQEFQDLINCPLSREEYIQKLVDNKIVD